MSTISDRIIEVRKLSGLNQTDFGAFGGVGKHTQINYEKGESYPDVRYLVSLADAGFDTSYIVFGKRYGDQLSPRRVEENLPATYLTPSKRASQEILQMALSEEDADLILAIARRVAAKV